MNAECYYCDEFYECINTGKIAEYRVAHTNEDGDRVYRTCYVRTEFCTKLQEVGKGERG